MRRGWVGCVAAIGLVMTAGCAGPIAPSQPTASGTLTTAVGSPTAPSADLPRDRPAGPMLSQLALLPVKGRAPLTGYSREEFGPAWPDVDANGCDTRDDMLRRDLRAVTMNGSCQVLSGDLTDPYTGATIHFVEGGGSEVDIDHVVALGDAWQKGAQALSFTQREHFANDPLNLLAVDAGANRQKGDGDAATWLPPNKTFRCAYVGRQIAVKARYRLWVTLAERAAMARVLGRCT